MRESLGTLLAGPGAREVYTSLFRDHVCFKATTPMGLTAEQLGELDRRLQELQDGVPDADNELEALLENLWDVQLLEARRTWGVTLLTTTNGRLHEHEAWKEVQRPLLGQGP